MTLQQLTENKVEFGKQLKAKRKAKYKTLKEFKFTTHLELSQIYSIERGDANYTIDTLIKYLRGLDNNRTNKG